jgi:hypothetical protein
MAAGSLLMCQNKELDRTMKLRIHALCLALNEEVFIGELLTSLYPFCSGISVLSQYDRDWYGKQITPDQTILKVLNFPDPAGKIHLVVRRWNDEAAARNHELFALRTDRFVRGVMPHGVSKGELLHLHQKPDYFLIVDADEIYDIDTFSCILEYLQRRKPRGMRVLGYNYVRTWNRRVPLEEIEFRHFGFVRPDVLFQMQRVVTWNESRLRKLLRIVRLPDISARLYGFIDCPPEIGVFHHGCWLGDNVRLQKKITISSHKQDWSPVVAQRIDAARTIFIQQCDMPRNIREGQWPASFFEN